MSQRLPITDDELAHVGEFFSLCADMLLVLAKDGTCELSNPAVSEILGYDAAELRGRSLLDFFHAEDRPIAEAARARLAKERRASFSARCRAKDGTHRPIAWRVQITPESERTFWIGADETEQHLVVRSHQELTSRHEAILRSVPDIIAEVDENKVYTWMNRAGYDFFGEDVIGKEASFFFEEDRDHTSIFETVEPLFQGAEDTIYVESWQRRKDGESRLLAWWCRGLKDEGGRVVGALSTARDITERKQMMDALRGSEQKVQALFENAAQGIITVDERGHIQTLNPMAVTLFGYEKEELLGEELEILIPSASREDHAQHRRSYFANPRTRPMGHGLDLMGRRKDGTEFPVEISLSYIGTKEEPVAVAFINDITERKRAQREKQRLEHRLEHATKMEAIGRLAGGIAHDFNNLLTALSGFSEIVLDELPEDHPLYEGAKETFKTCQRSASLVRRLLAVSRRQMLQPQVLDINQKVGEVEKMLRSVLGEDIELEVELSAEPGFVRADESQIEQVILNLVVNARDAMPKGGKLTISTANVEVDDALVDQHVGGSPGPYVRISVSDTGHGMDADTMEHIFEPFFTTKEKGKGTGLGLATVYGIVNQSGGHIWAYSDPGMGTTLKIYLPRVRSSGDTDAEPATAGEEEKGTETILVVEDENTVRLVAVNSLRKSGYKVLEARDGEEALRIASEYPGLIDLVLTDVVMPKLNGPELIERLSKTVPGIKALCMSGHADDALVQHDFQAEGFRFLEKPFTREELTKQVRDALDEA